MTMGGAGTAACRIVQLDEHHLEPLERTRQRVSGELAAGSRRGCLRIESDRQQRGRESGMSGDSA